MNFWVFQLTACPTANLLADGLLGRWGSWITQNLMCTWLNVVNFSCFGAIFWKSTMLHIHPKAMRACDSKQPFSVSPMILDDRLDTSLSTLHYTLSPIIIIIGRRCLSRSRFSALLPPWKSNILWEHKRTTTCSCSRHATIHSLLVNKKRCERAKGLLKTRFSTVIYIVVVKLFICLIQNTQT